MITLSTNATQWEREMRKCLDGIEFSVATRIKDIVHYIDMKVHARTPVYTGQAVRNMIWSTGSPNPTTYPPIESPADTGYTSMMGLGQEPRRPANEAAARDSLHQLNFNNPFQVFHLTNNSPDIGLIEDGTSGLPGMTRAPNGVFGITVAELIMKLKTGVPLK